MAIKKNWKLQRSRVDFTTSPNPRLPKWTIASSFIGLAQLRENEDETRVCKPLEWRFLNSILGYWTKALPERIWVLYLNRNKFPNKRWWQGCYTTISSLSPYGTQMDAFQEKVKESHTGRWSIAKTGENLTTNWPTFNDTKEESLRTLVGYPLSK